jgi:hypothetical protein
MMYCESLSRSQIHVDDCLIDALRTIIEGYDERAIAMLSDEGSMRVRDGEQKKVSYLFVMGVL